MISAEQFLRAVDGELLDHINKFAAAVPALAGITFGILIREDTALSFHHSG